MLLVDYGRCGIYLRAGNTPACGSCRWTGHEKTKFDPDRGRGTGMAYCPEMDRWVSLDDRCTHFEREPGTD